MTAAAAAAEAEEAAGVATPAAGAREGPPREARVLSRGVGVRRRSSAWEGVGSVVREGSEMVVHTRFVWRGMSGWVTG